MTRSSLIYRLVAVTLAASLIVSSTVGLACAQELRHELTVKKRFLRSPKFEYGLEDGGVYGFTGLSFTSEFEAVLAQDPAALKEAKQAFTYNAIGLAGSILMLVGAVKELSDTISDTDDVQSGTIPDNSTDWSNVYIIAAGAVVAVVGSMIGWRHVNKGVDMFNENRDIDLGMRTTTYEWHVGDSGIITEFAGEVAFAQAESPRSCLRGPVFCMGEAGGTSAE